MEQTIAPRPRGWRKTALRLVAAFTLGAAIVSIIPDTSWTAAVLFGLLGLAVTALPTLVAFTLVVSLIEIAAAYGLWQGERRYILYALGIDISGLVLLQISAILALAFWMARARSRLTPLNLCVLGIGMLAGVAVVIQIAR